jgi:hypothetical protein
MGRAETVDAAVRESPGRYVILSTHQAQDKPRETRLPAQSAKSGAIRVSVSQTIRMIRPLLIAIVAAWLALTAPPVVAADLVFAVTEGVTYYQTNKEIAARFLPLNEILARALKRPVRTVVVSPYNDLRAGLARQEYDLAFVHPAHVALAAVKTGKYKSVAWTTGYTDYTVSLLMNKDQPFTRLEDLRGRTVVSPDPDSITAAMLRSMLRDQKLGPTDITIITTRYQDAVPFYVEHGFAQAGATAAKAVRRRGLRRGQGAFVFASRCHQADDRLHRSSGRRRTAIHDVLLTSRKTTQAEVRLRLSVTRDSSSPRARGAKAIAWLGL